MRTMERILRLMAERKASDVYFSANASVQMRISGQCVPINTQVLPPEAPLALLTEMIEPERIEELTRTGELNMALSLENVGNYRISAMRQRGSYAIVVRHIAPKIPTLAELKLPDILKTLVMQPRGLILMVGATGVGKTSTLASMLDHRNEHSGGHILTVEEPIEYVFTNKKSLINQRDVGSDTESLHVALKNALRQAPDVIQIGEIRDRDTMSAAIAYAQAGHLCMATLHANNSYRALNRILSFYPVEVRSTLLGDLSSAMNAIVAQRLLRTPSGHRIPAVEIMMNTALISDLIERGDFSGVREAMEQSMAEGSQTFEENIASMIHDKLITREEGLAQADSPTNLLWRLANYNKPVIKPEGQEDASDEPKFTEIALDVRY